MKFARNTQPLVHSVVSGANLTGQTENNKFLISTKMSARAQRMRLENKFSSWKKNFENNNNERSKKRKKQRGTWGKNKHRETEEETGQERLRCFVCFCCCASVLVLRILYLLFVRPRLLVQIHGFRFQQVASVLQGHFRFHTFGSALPVLHFRFPQVSAELRRCQTALYFLKTYTDIQTPESGRVHTGCGTRLRLTHPGRHCASSSNAAPMTSSA